MLASKIAKYEEKTHKNLLSYLERTVVDGLTIYKIKSTYSSNYYYATESKKKGIVLHFTAGYLEGDISTLTKKDYHVSVPYVVARNGRIYQLHAPKYWSYHLGKGAVGGNTVCSKRNIAIEISNIGPLTKSGKQLNTYSGGKYCELTETEYFEKKTYRTKNYYATFTQAQYESVKKLLQMLCAKFKIPYRFILEDKRFDVFKDSSAAKSYTGISSHVNYRSDKFDIGPAFDWDKLIELSFPQKDFSKEEAKRLYKDSENDTLNYYPITAYGWWHNGVHLSENENDDIRAITDGEIIYTRLSRNEGNYGSPNFILIKHELEIDDKKVVFYSLYMHLKKVVIKKELTKNDEIPDWIKRKFYVKRDKGKITAVYDDGSVTLYKKATSRSDRLAELVVGDTFLVLEPAGSSSIRMKVKAKNKEGWIHHRGKVKLFDTYELKNWVFDKDTKKIRKELFSDDLAYKGPVRVSAGEVIGYMGNGIEHLEVKEHSTTTTKKATLLHFEIFSRTKNNAGKDVYEYIDGKPENYFFLKDSDDDVIAEPLKEKKGNLINLYKGKDKDFANYLEKEFPEAFRTKESNYMFWDEIVLKDDEVKKFMNKYKEKFRDAVTKHISIWQAIGNKITYVNSDEDDKIEGLNTFHLFKNEKVLNKNEKLYFYNPIRFIEILYNKLSSQSVKDSKSVSPTPVASGKKLLVRKVKGPDISEVDKTVKYTAVEFSKLNPTDAEKKTINWVVKERCRKITEFAKHGDVLEYSIPASLDGKTIRVMPYINSPTVKVSTTTTIGRAEDADTEYSISSKGLDLIKEFEGLKLKMYNDAADHCTIGYGHLIHYGKCDELESEEVFKDGITKEKAEELLKDKVKTFEKAVNRDVKVPLTQNQFDALVSFTYNLGQNILKGSSLLTKLNNKEYEAVPDKMLKYVYSGGRKLEGLVRRRTKEGKLFCS